MMGSVLRCGLCMTSLQADSQGLQLRGIMHESTGCFTSCHLVLGDDD